MATHEEFFKRARFKTKLRTIRLPIAVDATLEEEAEKRGMTTNSFVTSILARYAEWDLLAEKFRFIGFPMELVRQEISLIQDRETLKRMAADLGAKLPREVMLFWFKEVNVESFLKYLAIQSKYQKYADYEIAHRSDAIVIVAKHNLGPNWSLWLEAYVSEAIHSNLGVVPKTAVSENTVKFEFEKR